MKALNNDTSFYCILGTLTGEKISVSTHIILTKYRMTKTNMVQSNNVRTSTKSIR